MKKTRKPRNYAATESTLINLRALKKRVLPLEHRVLQLERSVSQLQKILARHLVK